MSNKNEKWVDKDNKYAFGRYSFILTDLMYILFLIRFCVPWESNPCPQHYQLSYRNTNLNNLTYSFLITIDYHLQICKSFYALLGSIVTLADSLSLCYFCSHIQDVAIDRVGGLGQLIHRSFELFYSWPHVTFLLLEGFL